MIDHRDFEFLEMYLKQNVSFLPEDKEAVSEGESGGSSEDHQERHLERSHHHHHQQHPHHYTHHASRGDFIIILSVVCV